MGLAYSVASSCVTWAKSSLKGQVQAVVESPILPKMWLHALLMLRSGGLEDNLCL